MVGTLVGVTMFLFLLLLGTQTLLHLYAASTLAAVTNEAADGVADAGGSPDAVAGAQEDALDRLGAFGAQHTTFTWVEVDGTQVVLRAVALAPGLLPLPASWDRLTTTVTVRTERFR
jgi:hypothetical protein